MDKTHSRNLPGERAEMRSIPLEVKKLPQDITLIVSVKLTRELKVRLWLAKRLWALGTKIAGCGIRFDEE